MSDNNPYRNNGYAAGAEAGWTIPNYDGAGIGWEGRADDQYLRRWTLSLSTNPQQPGQTDYQVPSGDSGVVITTETPGMDFRMTFKIRHADNDTPGTAEITIYNLSHNTANKFIKEYVHVSLQAGYMHGHYGLLFSGTIKQFKKGRESATDSYLTIYAADGDQAWNYSFIATTLPENAGDQDYTAAMKKSLEANAARVGHMDPATAGGTIGGVAPKYLRPHVMYGLAQDEGRQHERTTGRTWSIQNGVAQLVKRTSYLQGQLVVLNSGTGMIGVPEVTQDGIHVSCLLNPNLYVKQQIRVDNKTLNQMFAPGADPNKAGAQQTTYGAYNALPQYWASTNNDGNYTILVLDHEGDTRGQAWYSHLHCLNVDPTATFGEQVPGGSGFVELPTPEGEAG